MFYFCLEHVAMQLREASAPLQWLPQNFHPIHFIVFLEFWMTSYPSAYILFSSLPSKQANQNILTFLLESLLHCSAIEDSGVRLVLRWLLNLKSTLTSYFIDFTAPCHKKQRDWQGLWVQKLVFWGIWIQQTKNKGPIPRKYIRQYTLLKK